MSGELLETVRDGVHLVAAAALCLLLAGAALSDLRTFEIPNRVSAGILAAFPVAAVALGWPASQILWHLAAAAAVFLIGAGLFYLGAIGGGDVKLLAALSAWPGWAHLAGLLFFIALAGGVLALLVLVLRRVSLPARAGWWDLLRPAQTARREVPYAVAIACGAFAVLWRWPAVAG